MNEVIKIIGKKRRSDNTIQPVKLTRNLLWKFTKLYFKSLFGKKYEIWALEYTNDSYGIVVQKDK